MPRPTTPGRFADQSATIHRQLLRAEILESRDVPDATGLTATGAAAGTAPIVTVYNSDGSVHLSFLAFESTFTGGVTVAVADVTGDGVPDVVVVPGAGGGPLMKVFNAETGAPELSRFVFEDSFRNGLTVAAGDVTGAGYAQILIGAGYGGAPRVQLYDAVTNTTMRDYFAFDPNSRGGVSVAIASLVPNGPEEIITGGVNGATPQVTVTDGANNVTLGTYTVSGSTNSTSVSPSLRDLLDSTPVGNSVTPVGVSVTVGNPDSLGVRHLLISLYDSTTMGPQIDVDPTTFATLP
ncbi:hypothetical protein [Fimbriiglobus ruber]|uniref:Alkaline phosphatase n=1 Tax=Fimbriiglobus ruber TaxID=1908690 RepID=A0A225E583_9BACT|nr:hypothetical protein [Fimbriiglobus ruber]OWK43577.1 Alkaline phosphatase [Fimbriiglobus ruber]